MLKKVNKDPFSNGSEYESWESRNCAVCVKASRYKGETSLGIDDYTKGRCSIQRDIFSRMMSDEPIAQRTIDACSKRDCPYRRTSYPQKKKRSDTNDPRLF